MRRKIVEIDRDKCNGCGLCAKACHEGAIELRDGKAYLISDEYCDGFGDCLPECPTGAIKIIERNADEYNEAKVQKKKMESQIKNILKGGCPGSRERVIKKPDIPEKQEKIEYAEKIQSELRQWPIQLNLINPKAGYLNGADLLIAADCTAYAYGNFHKDFIKNRITLIGCPKLDDISFYKEKLTEILKSNDIKSITVVRMEVPCCGGIANAVKQAMLDAQVIVPYKEVTISTDGQIYNIWD